MKNEVIFDGRGIPDIMVAFTPDELGLPSELKGRKVEAYLIGKYQATMIDGVPHSLPYQKPAANVSHDDAIRLCEAKGPGWHLITNDEWAALAHMSMKNGTLPRGNTDDGKSHDHPEEKGVTYDGSYGRTLTGSGPVTWNHDHTAEGVADMCGNIWEHVGGIRFLNGQVQVIPDNGAAAGADQSQDSKEWRPIYTADGDPIYYDVNDGEITLRATEPTEKHWDGVRFTELNGQQVDEHDELIRLGLYPAPGYEGTDYFWLDTNGERCVYRGGYWASGANAGVFYLSGSDSRSSVYANIGFRPAFVRYSGDSGDLDHLNEETEKNTEAATEAPKPSLLDLVRQMLARSFGYICNTLGFEQIDAVEVSKAALRASAEEMQQASTYLTSLAQAAIAVNGAKAGMEATRKALGSVLNEEGGRDHE